MEGGGGFEILKGVGINIRVCGCQKRGVMHPFTNCVPSKPKFGALKKFGGMNFTYVKGKKKFHNSLQILV